MLEGGFSARIRAIVPAPPIDALVDALDDGTKAYAAIGVGSIREALVTLGGWQAYRSAREQDRLHVRVRVLVNLDPLTSLADRLALIEAIAPDLAIGDDRLRLWGCKVVIDGGPASAARSEPYVNDRDGVVV